MLNRIKQRILWPHREDREAVEKYERILRAFMEGDTEVINAEIARRHGKLFALLAETSKPLDDTDK